MRGSPGELALAVERRAGQPIADEAHGLRPRVVRAGRRLLAGGGRLPIQQVLRELDGLVPRRASFPLLALGLERP